MSRPGKVTAVTFCKHLPNTAVKRVTLWISKLVIQWVGDWPLDCTHIKSDTLRFTSGAAVTIQIYYESVCER